MGELRRDYILDRWVLIVPNREKRPKDFKAHLTKKKGVCLFCPGNEESEVGRIGENGKWRIRWFRNKFPALKPEGNPHPQKDHQFFTHANAYGYHEVIVDTPRHDRQLAQLSVKEIEDVLHVYARRIVELEKNPNIQYVNVFKNEGFFAGTSMAHAHSQVMATAKIPVELAQKVAAVQSALRCPYCEVIELERKSDRFCFENDDFIAFAPYASRFPYEIWIFPKTHIAKYADFNFAMLAKIVSKVLKKVSQNGLDYDMFIQYGPKDDDFHAHVEICPRKSIWGGFELESGNIINTVPPEDAASFYRGENT